MAQTAGSDLGQLADQLHLEEFRILRGEIELRSAEQRGMERNVVLAAAAIYGFLLAPKGGVPAEDMPFVGLAWYLPPLFGFLGFIRWRESVKMIDALAEYIRGLELRAAAGGGWETFLAAQRESGQLPIASAWYALFWDVVCAGSLVLAAIRRPLVPDEAVPSAIALGAIGAIVVSILVMVRPRPVSTIRDSG